ncbi:unnamed protein product, partial [Ectocarpus sp. 12 AP-2014]
APSPPSSAPPPSPLPSLSLSPRPTAGRKPSSSRAVPSPSSLRDSCRLSPPRCCSDLVTRVAEGGPLPLPPPPPLTSVPFALRLLPLLLRPPPPPPPTSPIAALPPPNMACLTLSRCLTCCSPSLSSGEPGPWGWCCCCRPSAAPAAPVPAFGLKSIP